MCACTYVDVAAEACGSCGPGPLAVPLCGEQTGVKKRTHQSWANFTLCRPMRKKNVKPTSPGKYTAQGPRQGPRLDSLNKKTTLGALQIPPPHPLPLGHNSCLDGGSELLAGAAHGGGCGVPSPGERRSSIWGGGGEGLFLLEPLSPPPPWREHKQIPVLGGGGGLAPQSLEGCPGTHTGRGWGQGRRGTATPKPQ